jgi:putative NADH-flavin reductase
MKATPVRGISTAVDSMKSDATEVGSMAAGSTGVGSVAAGSAEAGSAGEVDVATAASAGVGSSEAGSAEAGSLQAGFLEAGSMSTGPIRARRTIAVIGATGMVGSRVIDEAVARGHRVLALSRKPANADRVHPDVTPVAVDARDPQAVREALTGAASTGAADAVVLALRTVPVDEEFLVGATRTVLDIAARLGIQVLVVGGAGALRSPGDRDLLVADNPAYVPVEVRSVAAAGIAQLRTCQTHGHDDWTYLSPPALLQPGERTGRYRRGTDTLLTTADGGSWISAEDLAVAALDELETPGPEHHITVAYHDATRQA